MDGIYAIPDEVNATIVHAIVLGPFDTPYESGFFYFVSIYLHACLLALINHVSAYLLTNLIGFLYSPTISDFECSRRLSPKSTESETDDNWWWKSEV